MATSSESLDEPTSRQRVEEFSLSEWKMFDSVPSSAIKLTRFTWPESDSFTLSLPEVTVFGGVAAVGLDLGAAPQPERLAFKWIQTTLAAADGPAFLYAHWSVEDTTFSDIDNGELIGVMDCAAASDVELVGDFLVRARFLKLSIFNESGGTLDFTGSNSDIDLQENFGDQA